MKEREKGSSQEVLVKSLSPDSKVIFISSFPFDERDSQFNLIVEVSGEFIQRLDKIIRGKQKKVVVVAGEDGVLRAKTFPIAPKKNEEQPRGKKA